MISLLLLTFYWPGVYLGTSVVLGLIAALIVALTCRHKNMFRRKLMLAFLTPATAIAAAFFSIFISGMLVGYFLHTDKNHQSELQTELSKDYELRASDMDHLSNARILPFHQRLGILHKRKNAQALLAPRVLLAKARDCILHCRR